MTKGSPSCLFARAGLVALGALILFWCATSSSLSAGEPSPASAQPASAQGEDFGKYLADHQSDLGPFFKKNTGNLVKLAIPLVIGLTGWVIFLTMLAGWVIDVLMSRGFAFFFAPACADMKRAVIYATGRLFLSAVYSVLMGFAIIFTLGLPHFGIIMLIAMPLLLLVGLAAQIVWILYLFRTDFPISAFFYLAIIVVHFVAAILISGPIAGARASHIATDFIDRAITPRLQAEVESTKQQLAAAKSARDAVGVQADELQNKLSQARTEEDQLRREIETKKNSDIYLFSQIVKVRAQGDLPVARDRLTNFLAKFPSSPLDAAAHSQLAQIDAEMAARTAQKKQDEANAARAEVQARADLLARAAKGEVTLSEMRQALIGKTRAQVTSLLGTPTQTASDSWSYSQQMIINPLTNEKHGLIVYFAEGTVQGVDYYRGGGAQ